jgi:coenzyme Q-binding protein COQ10
MNSLEVRKHIHHDWTDLFELVAEPESYPQFVPCCQRTVVLSRKTQGPDKTVVVSRMTVGLSALHVSYANRTVADLGKQQIRIEGLDGPLRHLEAVWTFVPDSDGGTDVGFTVDYEFSSPMLGALASHVFDSMFRQILDALELRADSVLGGRGAAVGRAVARRVAPPVARHTAPTPHATALAR